MKQKIRIPDNIFSENRKLQRGFENTSFSNGERERTGIKETCAPQPATVVLHGQFQEKLPCPTLLSAWLHPRHLKFSELYVS